MFFLGGGLCFYVCVFFFGGGVLFFCVCSFFYKKKGDVGKNL